MTDLGSPLVKTGNEKGTDGDKNLELEIHSLTNRLNEAAQALGDLQNALDCKDGEMLKKDVYIQMLEKERKELAVHKAQLQSVNAVLQSQKDAMQMEYSKLMMKCMMFANEIFPFNCQNHANSSLPSASSPHLSIGQQRVSPISTISQLSNQMQRLSPNADQTSRIYSTVEMKLRICVGSAGIGLNLGTPQGFTIDSENEIAIADTNNNRCLVVDVNGKFLKEIGRPGTSEGCLNFPRKIISLPTSHSYAYIVLDRGPTHFNRLQLFDNKGAFVCRLVAALFASEQINVMTFNKDNGQLVLYDNKNNVLAMDLKQLPNLRTVSAFSVAGIIQEASDIIVYQEKFYITDYKAHSVVVYDATGKFLQKFGGISLTPYPIGVDVSSTGDILVADSHGNHFHVAVFNCAGELQQDYKYLAEKVSRCIGLKITTEGYLVTIARQSNSLLVFDTLFTPPADLNSESVVF